MFSSNHVARRLFAGLFVVQVNASLSQRVCSGQDGFGQHAPAIGLLDDAKEQRLDQRILPGKSRVDQLLVLIRRDVHHVGFAGQVQRIDLADFPDLVHHCVRRDVLSVFPTLNRIETDTELVCKLLLRQMEVLSDCLNAILNLHMGTPPFVYILSHKSLVVKTKLHNF